MNSQNEMLEAVIIGSGFGGAISFCRLAQKWQDKVLLLERGKRYPMGSFPRSPHDMANNFWNPKGDQIRRPKHIRKHAQRGLFDIRNYTRMDAVVSAGLGGGSLIYANVYLEPPEQTFQRGWPKGIDKGFLQPYYEVARQVLGARPIPDSTREPRRHVVRKALFEEFAASQKQQSKPADLCVFFGKDFHHPTPIGIQETNRYGATQTSCTYCGECDVGCNTHSKNTLDLNYLHVAEHEHKGRIQTDCQVEFLVPLNEHREEDQKADGSFGYRIHYRDLEHGSLGQINTRRVVVAAGTLGSNELLLRCRDEHGTLPRISPALGQRFSGNGDFVSFVAEGDKPADPNYGPVITQYIDYKLYDQHDPDRGFVMEDASYPAFIAWAMEGAQPSLNLWGFLKKLVRIMRTLVKLVWQRVCGKWTGSVGNLFHQMLKGDLSYRSSILLCMGLDKGDGVLTLRDGNLDLHWPQKSSMPLYQAILDSGKQFGAFVRSPLFFALPTWFWPFRNNITVHPLGGCALADSPELGVVSAHPHDRGQVFGYQGLYVADGSILPSAVGANPVATICALSEWIAHGITAAPKFPDATLK